MSGFSSSAEDRPLRLSTADAETLAVYVAELSAAGLPLAPGLRAAAEETGGRLAGNLRSLAAALDRGESLEQVLQTPEIDFPQYLQGLIQASLQTGQLGEMLIDLVDQRRAAREQWQAVWSALFYPLVLFALTTTIFFVLTSFIAPVLDDLLTGTAVDLPLITSWLITLGKISPVWAPGMLGGLLAVLLALRFCLGPVRWRQMVSAIPLFGPLWHWTVVAETTRMLGSLVKRRVALPEALRLTAAGVSDAYVAAACRGFAQEIEQGGDLAVLIATSGRWPVSLAPLIRWGQLAGRLDEAFDASTEMLEGRVRLRAALLRAILPPFVFLAAAALALTLFVGFFAPALTFIRFLL